MKSLTLEVVVSGLPLLVGIEYHPGRPGHAPTPDNPGYPPEMASVDILTVVLKGKPSVSLYELFSDFQALWRLEDLCLEKTNEGEDDGL